jgi:hypothetical protein
MTSLAIPSWRNCRELAMSSSSTWRCRPSLFIRSHDDVDSMIVFIALDIG